VGCGAVWSCRPDRGAGAARGVLTGATLKWKDGTAHKSGLIYAGVSVTTEPWSVIGGTIDMNRNNTPALANKETTGCGIHITASGAGWTGAYVLDGVTVLNAPGNAFRVLGTASAVMGTTNADAANTADSAVHINRPVVRNSYRGISVDRAGGCVINSPDILNTDRDGIYQFLCRSLQVTGGVIRNAGTSGNLTGHGLVDVYGVGTVWQGTEVIGASYNGFCAGGGEPTNAATRDFRWMGLRASGASCGLSIDITLTGGSTVAGHTVYAGAQLVGNTAVNNGIHGLYLHSASAVNVAALTAMGNAQSGIAGDSYRCTIDSADLQHNTFGLNLQGGTPVKTDGSALGVSGKYTGYGHLRPRRRRLPRNRAAGHSRFHVPRPHRRRALHQDRVQPRHWHQRQDRVAPDRPRLTPHPSPPLTQGGLCLADCCPARPATSGCARSRPEPMDFLSSLPWSGISGGAVGVAVLLAIIRGDFIPRRHHDEVVAMHKAASEVERARADKAENALKALQTGVGATVEKILLALPPVRNERRGADS
jgi:hypothetical protein